MSSDDIMADLTICKLCDKVTAKYTCPRCNARYCSVDCYRSEAHMQCSELFYRNCFMNGLQGMEADGEERKKILEMLQRLEQENVPEEDFEEDDEEDLSDRLADVDLNRHPEMIWKRLTAHEKQEFAEMVKANKMGEIVEVWKPWWCEVVPALMETSDDGELSRVPAIWKGVIEFEALLGSVRPSDTICFDVLNMLYGYAYITRLYNGDCADLLIDCAQGMIAIAGSLESCKFSDASSALNHCLMRLAAGEKGESFFVSKEFSTAVIVDVARIVKGPNVFRPHLYINAALSESCVMFRNARKKLEKETKKSGIDSKCGKEDLKSGQKQVYFQAQKKLEFYMSWIGKYGDILVGLVPQIEMEFCALSSELVQHKNDCSKVQDYLKEQKLLKGKKLIEEI